MSVEALRSFLRSLPPGPVSNVADLGPLLAECWEDLAGGDEDGMAGHKLRRRMEDIVWTPPVLAFAIERHGATVLGSTTAEIQYWSVDVETLTACPSGSGKRYVSERSAPVDVKPLAVEIVAAIVEGKPSPYLKWYSADDVKVLTASVFPADAGFKQTQSARRKRLRNAIDAALLSHGWKQTTGLGAGSGANPLPHEILRPSRGREPSPTRFVPVLASRPLKTKRHLRGAYGGS